jgi:hypothetical protein
MIVAWTPGIANCERSWARRFVSWTESSGVRTPAPEGLATVVADRFGPESDLADGAAVGEPA